MSGNNGEMCSNCRWYDASTGECHGKSAIKWADITDPDWWCSSWDAETQNSGIDEDSSGDNEIVPAQAGKIIYVHGLHLNPALNVGVSLKGGSTTLFDTISISNVYNLPYSEKAWMKTGVGEALNMTLGLAVRVTGLILYKVY